MRGNSISSSWTKKKKMCKSICESHSKFKKMHLLLYHERTCRNMMFLAAESRSVLQRLRETNRWTVKYSTVQQFHDLLCSSYSLSLSLSSASLPTMHANIVETPPRVSLLPCFSRPFFLSFSFLSFFFQFGCDTSPLTHCRVVNVSPLCQISCPRHPSRKGEAAWA